MEYVKVKSTSLKLKGEKSIKKKHKSKKRKLESEETTTCHDVDDSAKHGGWWKITSSSQIKGTVAIQHGESPVYIKALDQGHFTIGAPQNEGDGPDPEEILTAIPAGADDKIAFKSGYGKYLGIDGKGNVVGVADAIGPREHWQVVFQDDKSALLGSNDCFLSVDDDDNVIATNRAAGPLEMVTLRSNRQREKNKTSSVPDIEKGRLKDVEKNYVKMFQKFQDKKTKICPDSRKELKEAKTEGALHEALLDRRAKMKADRYCK